MSTKKAKKGKKGNSKKPGKPKPAVKPAVKALPLPTANARFAGVVGERERLQAAVAGERADRMAAYSAAMQEPGGAPVFGAGGAPVLRILAEGDSWFDYPPGKDVIEQLSQMIKLPIANMAHHGDEVREMFALKQRKEVEKRLSQGAPGGRPWDAMLFSGGGNDIVGDELCIWIKPFTTGMGAADLIDAARFGAVLEIVDAGYRDLVNARDRLSSATKLFFHEYDFAPPNNKGVCFVGPWLQPSLNFRLVPPELQAEVVKLMLEQFALKVKAVAASTSNAFVVPTQNTFPAQTSEWWANELHPTDKGFKAIAGKFRDTMKAQFPGLP